MSLVLQVLAVAALLLIVVGPWLAIPLASYVPYQLARRRSAPAPAARVGISSLLALGAAIATWGAYVAPALHRPGQSCPDPGWGVVAGGYAALLVPTALLSAAAGLSREPRTTNVLQALTILVAPVSLIALLFLQRGMLCHFGD